MRHLAYSIQEQEHSSVMNELKTLLTNSTMGQLFEREMHNHLYEKFSRGGEMQLTRLYPSGASRSATVGDYMRINVKVNRKVFIRTIDDIRELQDFEYGMPSVTNFPLIDFVIKLPTYSREPWAINTPGPNQGILTSKMPPGRIATRI